MRMFYLYYFSDQKNLKYFFVTYDILVIIYFLFCF